MNIYHSVLKNYLPHKKKDRRGLSPLDIPMSTVLKILLISFILTLVVGYTCIFILKLMATNELRDGRTTKINLASQDSGNAITRQVIYYLIPNQSLQSKIPSMEADLNTKMQLAFKDTDITYSSFIAFLNSIDSTHKKEIEKLDEYIIGDITCSGIFGMLNYDRKSADVIADSLGLKLNFNEEIKDENPDKIKRDITISTILKFRDQLKASVIHPLRLLIALDGFIQWLTFFAFIFCSLTLILRHYWAKMQLRIITQPSSDNTQTSYIKGLPGYKNDVFKLNGEKKSLEKLREEYPNLFIAQRYVDEVQNSLAQDSIQPKSLYDTMQQKINFLKQSVEDGEYLIINFLLWLIPSLGFIGTIIGIIGAMENASGIFEATGAGALAQIIALQNVAVNLGTAFDTTFVSLVLISILMLYNAVVQKTEDLIFVRLDRVSSDYFIYELKYFTNRE